MRQKKVNPFVVGDRVAWSARQLVTSGRDVRAEEMTGVITSMRKDTVVIQYAPGRFRQVTIGTQDLRKVVGVGL